jgi:CheY-like chemotaxis protein
MSRRVLIVEDDAVSRELLRDVLTGSAYEVVEAQNGKEALEAIKSELPRMIIMDIQMPVLDGYATLRELRRNPRLASVPIIALTAFAMSTDRERIMQAGFSDYLTKPLELGVLRQLLEKWASR